jgi:hypothetical protein
VPTDGTQVGFTNGGDISQILASVLTAGTTYTLQADFLARIDCCGSFATQLSLLAGSTVLATFNGSALSTGAIRTDSLSYTALAGDPNIGQALEIRIGTGASTGVTPQLVVDNVRLDASVVPEPATVGLIGMGLLFSAVLARRQKARL